MMNGHPAIAYMVALQMLEERQKEARAHQLAKTASGARTSRPRTLRLGNYRLTITKEVRRVPRTV